MNHLYLFSACFWLILQKTTADSCPSGFTASNDGDCFAFLQYDDTTFNFTEGQDACQNFYSYAALVTILSEESNNFVISTAQSLWGDSVFYLGLQCVNGNLKWSEQCFPLYTNFNETDDLTCSDESVHYIAGGKDPIWRVALEGLRTSKLVCSISSLYGGCIRSDPDHLVIQFVTELILLGIALLTVVVLTILVCTCLILFVRRRNKKEQRLQEEEKKRNECMQALEDANIDVNFELGKFKFQVGKSAAMAIGAAADAKGLERTPSVRYTPFPRAEGAAKEFDEWEIDRRHVSIDYTTKLGQGAFGSVYLGIVDNANIPAATGKSIIEMSALKKDNNAVAIKMLHESADKLQQMQFFEEIELMKRLGYHERLVNMLACATQSEPALLIIEYCSHGDLLNYMRERRQFMLGAPEAMSSLNRSKIITQKQQLMFCVQIAYGLEYLSQQGFVHRDIAARNILVDQNESCKIGDFGLCREVEKQDEHYHSRGGRLPLKWMSPEAIERYDFSIASDVWAFGVLLFEIITLGGNPYPDWPATEILNRLKRGRRMDRPDNCTDHMFTVMNSCWLLIPSDRPSFSELRMKMGIGLEEVSEDDYYLKLNARAMYYCTQSETDEGIEVVEDPDESIRL